VFEYPLGEGIGVGPLEPWHAEQFAASVEHARTHIAPWIPFAHTVTDVDSAREMLQRFAANHADDSRHFYAIWQDDRIVGGVMFPRWDARNGICELGVWLAPEMEGRGLITRACRHLIDWAIRVRGMSRVEWHTDPRNTRSQAVALRLGMTLEGVQRSAHVVAGERQDSQVWSILADEWPGRPEPGATGQAPPVALFNSSYGNFHTPEQAAVRAGAFGGEDIGQTSWLTADEWRRYLQWLEVSKASRLLDVGSGGGGPAVWAAAETGCRVVGVDIHPQGVEAATKLAADRGLSERVRFIEADASLGLPFDDGAFDAVTCIDAVNHLPDRPAVLAEWRRVLRPGGQLLYTDPIVMTGMLSNREIAVRSSIGFFQFTPPGLNERLLGLAGFDLIRSDDATDNMATVARRWRSARAEHRDALVRLEGPETFDGQQRFFQMTAELASERRLSRYAFHAVNGRPPQGRD
jgi:RimJ/RimL family protein N-acetyltransferase/SAM-dependent methyltransferase